MQSTQAADKRKELKIEEQKLIKKMFPNHTINLKWDYDRWDLIEENKKYVMEVKIREFSMDFFKTTYKGNPLIEQEKFWENYVKANELGYKFIYVFGFRNADKKIEGYTVYNLQDLPANEFWEKTLLCPENSIEPDSPKKWKDCYIINNRLFNSGNSRTKKFDTPL